MNAKHVRVSDTMYQFVHGHKPRGEGSWAFEVAGKVVWQDDYIPGYAKATNTYGMMYSEAKAAVRRYAAAMNVWDVKGVHMNKPRRVYMDNTSYLVNSDRIVTRAEDGEVVGNEEAQRVLRRLDARARQAANRRDTEEVYRSLGLRKVRGTTTGRTYWE